MEFDSEGLEGFFEFVLPHLDEKQRRLVAGAMARLVGRGGPTVVAETSGLSRNTVIDGAKAFDAGEEPTGRVRREGGGGPRREDVDPGMMAPSPEAAGVTQCGTGRGAFDPIRPLVAEGLVEPAASNGVT